MHSFINFAKLFYVENNKNSIDTGLRIVLVSLLQSQQKVKYSVGYLYCGSTTVIGYPGP